MRLAAVILATDFSLRMGRATPLISLAGKTLLAHCAASFHQAKLHRILVITGQFHEEVAAEAQRLGLQNVHNPHYLQGIYSSLQTAVRNLPKIDGFFLLPVNVPLVRPATLISLITAFDGRNVILPRFAAATGHPLLIPAHLVAAILENNGAAGLQGLLDCGKSKELKEVHVCDKGILLDADTPENLAALAVRIGRLAIGERAEAIALANMLLSEKAMLHGLSVAQVAETLGLALNGCGGGLDADLLYNSALLHDIAKGRSRHEAVGAQLLRNFGLTRLADVVAQHRDCPPPKSANLSEKEVVYLADKLIRGQYRVSIQQRFNEKLELYSGNKSACRAARRRRDNALAIQDTIARTTGKTIEEILGSSKTL